MNLLQGDGKRHGKSAHWFEALWWILYIVKKEMPRYHFPTHFTEQSCSCTVLYATPEYIKQTILPYKSYYRDLIRKWEFFFLFMHRNHLIIAKILTGIPFHLSYRWRVFSHTRTLDVIDAIEHVTSTWNVSPISIKSNQNVYQSNAFNSSTHWQRMGNQSHWGPMWVKVFGMNSQLASNKSV